MVEATGSYRDRRVLVGGYVQVGNVAYMLPDNRLNSLVGQTVPIVVTETGVQIGVPRDAGYADLYPAVECSVSAQPTPVEVAE